MKRRNVSWLLILTLLALSALVMFTACKKSDDDKDIIGQWLMTYDWDCDGSTATVTWTINKNGNYSSSSGSTGTWQISGKSVTFIYSNGARYTGTVDNSWEKMTGTSRDPSNNTGCWTAEKI